MKNRLGWSGQPGNETSSKFQPEHLVKWKAPKETFITEKIHFHLHYSKSAKFFLRVCIIFPEGFYNIKPLMSGVLSNRSHLDLSDCSLSLNVFLSYVQYCLFSFR